MPARRFNLHAWACPPRDGERAVELLRRFQSGASTMQPQFLGVRYAEFPSRKLRRAGWIAQELKPIFISLQFRRD
jgi:hypothetical protein